jgi:cell division septation protein DedD
MASLKSDDTEITLDVGKMLALFFGLVALCAVFFGLGFSTGKKASSSAQLESSPTPASSGVSPSTLKTTAAPASSSNLTFYKAVGDSDANSQLTAKDPANPPATPAEPPKPAPPSPATPAPTTAPTTGYFVQVAAVSKQEDAEALVDALKKKQYPALIANATDKLFHVQVGPYGDIKDAEATRGKLIGDGYSPILKK